jgi:hypothetical protein
MSLQNILVDAVKSHLDKDDDKDDLRPALSHASANASSEDSNLFSQALSFINQRKSEGIQDDDIDEEQAVNAHRRYEQGGSMDSKDFGASAALQALKMFNSSSGQETGGGKDKNAFIGMAMAQAAQMWEEKAGKGEAVSLRPFCLLLHLHASLR